MRKSRTKHALRNIPVNYAVRFSGPVTALTARRIQYSVGVTQSASPGAVLGINARPPYFFHHTFSTTFSTTSTV